MKKEEKDVLCPEEEEVEVKDEVEIEDMDIGLNEKHVEAVAKENEKKTTERHVLTPEQQEVFKDILAAAKMPVKMTDGKFAMGENELDIRYLSKHNKEQMMFRTGVLSNVYLKQILTSLVDVTRLLMIIADKLGVENIVKATDDIIEKIDEQTKFKEQLKKAEDKKQDA